MVVLISFYGQVDEQVLKRFMRMLITSNAGGHKGKKIDKLVENFFKKSTIHDDNEVRGLSIHIATGLVYQKNRGDVCQDHNEEYHL